MPTLFAGNTAFIIYPFSVETQARASFTFEFFYSEIWSSGVLNCSCKVLNAPKPSKSRRTAWAAALLHSREDVALVKTALNDNAKLCWGQEQKPLQLSINLSLKLKAEAQPKEPLFSESRLTPPHLAPASPASCHTAPVTLGKPHGPSGSFVLPLCVFSGHSTSYKRVFSRPTDKGDTYKCYWCNVFLHRKQDIRIPQLYWWMCAAYWVSITLSK